MKKTKLSLPAGFRCGGVAAGIKRSGKPDVGLIVADRPCTAAGMFTTNKIIGPAVVIDRAHVKNGRAQAIIVNSGNANTCTGRKGVQNALAVCRDIAARFDMCADDVLICSTGIIGHHLPMKKLSAGIAEVSGKLSASVTGAARFSKAILTTDLRPKTAGVKIKLPGGQVTIFGCAKGSGMIAPNMATMLAFILTDANIHATALRRVFREAVGQTFNKVSVDSHMSTSDTALVLASGRADNTLLRDDHKALNLFAAALREVCDSLARQIAADGEGATRLVTVRVEGAATPQDARRAVCAIVDSPLIRCAFHGADPNWGRIVSAVGYCGARIAPEKLTCRIAGVTVFAGGRPRKFDPRRLSERMKQPAWAVEVDLAAGRCGDFRYTCDLSRDYVRINADYHT